MQRWIYEGRGAGGMYLPLPRPHEMSCSFMVIQNLLYHLLCILKNSHHVIALS